MNKNKEGRTLLIMKNQEVDDFENVISNFKSETGTRFVEFDSVVNCEKVFADLVSKNIKCKYSHYNLFFRITKNLNNINITSFKYIFIKKLEQQYQNINILDLNLYMKDNKLIGTGYVVVDRIIDFNNILDNDNLILSNDNKDEFITFYKFFRKNNNLYNNKN